MTSTTTNTITRVITNVMEAWMKTTKTAPLQLSISQLPFRVFSINLLNNIKRYRHQLHLNSVQKVRLSSCTCPPNHPPNLRPNLTPTLPPKPKRAAALFSVAPPIYHLPRLTQPFQSWSRRLRIRGGIWTTHQRSPQVQRSPNSEKEWAPRAKRCSPTATVRPPTTTEPTAQRCRWAHCASAAIAHPRPPTEEGREGQQSQNQSWARFRGRGQSLTFLQHILCSFFIRWQVDLYARVKGDVTIGLMWLCVYRWICTPEWRGMWQLAYCENLLWVCMQMEKSVLSTVGV